MWMDAQFYNRRMPRPLRVACVLALLTLTLAAKTREFSMPRAFHAKTYPARDTHDDEKFTVAADPYDLQEKTAPVFAVDYLKEGLLPIQVIFSNDADSPASISKVSVTFITRNRTKILPAQPDDIFRRISKQIKRGDEPKGMPLPPVFKKKSRTISEAAQEEVESMDAKPKAVEPKSTQSAIYIFDVETLDHPLAGAKLVVTGVRRDSEELFYFEIPMEKYLTYQPTAPQSQSEQK
jgi:hypothetical protein